MSSPWCRMSFSTPSSPASPTLSVSPSAASWGGWGKKMMFVFQMASNEGLKLTLDLFIFCYFSFFFFCTIEAKYQRAAAESSSIPAFMSCYQNTKQRHEGCVARGTRSQSEMHIHIRHELNIISGAEMSIMLFELIALTRSQHIRSRHLSSSASMPTSTAVSG